MDVDSMATLHLLTVATRLIREKANKKLAPLALTTTTVAVLKALLDLGPVSQAELASYLGVKGQSLVTTLPRMEDQGFITRQECSGDRRKIIVSLTASGQGAVWTAQHLQTRSSSDRALSEERARALRDLLSALISDLREDPDPPD